MNIDLIQINVALQPIKIIIIQSYYFIYGKLFVFNFALKYGIENMKYYYCVMIFCCLSLNVSCLIGVRFKELREKNWKCPKLQAKLWINAKTELSLGVGIRSKCTQFESNPSFRIPYFRIQKFFLFFFIT